MSMSYPRSPPAAATRPRHCERGAGNGDYRCRWKRRHHPQPALSRLAVAPAVLPAGRRRQAFRAIDRDRRVRAGSGTAMPNSFGAGDEDVKGPVRIPVCLRSAKTRKVCCGCWEGGDSEARMRQKPSQIRSEMREVMSGFPRSYARGSSLRREPSPAPSFPHSIRSPTGVCSSSPIIRLSFDGNSGAGQVSIGRSRR